MLHIAVVEDEPNEQKLIVDYLNRYAAEKHLAFQITVFSDAILLLTGYQPIYHLIFMDISMPLMNGMEAAKKLRDIDSSVLLIFVTALARYAVGGYAVDALDFIVKPVSYDELALKISRAMIRVEQKKDYNLVLVSGSELYRINVSDIVYIEVRRHVLLYHCVSGVIQSYGTLKKIVQQEEFHYFLLCNSCYLINPHFVKGVQGFTLLIGGEELQISHPKKKEFMQALTNYLGGIK